MDKKYQCVTEAIKRGEFKELSDNELKAYCCQSNETSMLNDDDLLDDIQLTTKSDETTDCVSSPGNAESPQFGTTDMEQKSVSQPTKSRGRPRKSTVGKRPAPSLSDLKAKPLKIRLTDVKKDTNAGPALACNGQCSFQSTIKQESYDNVYIKQEPIETEKFFSESEGENKPSTIENNTIANQIMGNIQQMFMMLQKDSDDNDSIDVNSFLTNS